MNINRNMLSEEHAEKTCCGSRACVTCAQNVHSRRGDITANAFARVNNQQKELTEPESNGTNFARVLKAKQNNVNTNAQVNSNSSWFSFSVGLSLPGL